MHAGTTKATVDNTSGALTAFIGSGNYNNGDKASIKSAQTSAYSSTFTGYVKKDGTTYTAVTNPFTVQHNSSTASYIPNVEYNITINANGGTGGTANGTKYRPSAAYTLTNPTPTNPFYIFKGWTGSNGTTAQTSVTISKGSQGDKSYDANWEIDLFSDSHVKISKTSTILGSGSHLGFQGDAHGKFYAMKGNFTQGSDPNIRTNGTLIYDAGASDTGGNTDNFIHAERLANLMNYLLYKEKGSSYGTNTLWYDHTTGSSANKSISKGFYNAQGGDTIFSCAATGYAGCYSSSNVPSRYFDTAWW